MHVYGVASSTVFSGAYSLVSLFRMAAGRVIAISDHIIVELSPNTLAMTAFFKKMHLANNSKHLKL